MVGSSIFGGIGMAVFGEMEIAAMPTKCMMQMPAARSSGAMNWTLRPSLRARLDGERAAGDAEHRAHRQQGRVPDDVACDVEAPHGGEVHADGREADRSAADQSGRRTRAVSGDRKSDRGEEDCDEEGAAGQRRVVADADRRLEREQRHEVGGPHDGAGRETGEEQPAAAALLVLARLGKKKQRYEAAERADRSCKKHELRVVALQDFATA